jgi:hypothetical protein
MRLSLRITIVGVLTLVALAVDPSAVLAKKAC